MAEAGFEEIGTYVTRRQNKVAQYIATQQILELFELSVWRPGGWISWRWRYQEGLDLEKVNERATVEL